MSIGWPPSVTRGANVHCRVGSYIWNELPSSHRLNAALVKIIPHVIWCCTVILFLSPVLLLSFTSDHSVIFFFLPTNALAFLEYCLSLYRLQCRCRCCLSSRPVGLFEQAESVSGWLIQLLRVGQWRVTRHWVTNHCTGRNSIS